MVELYVFFNGIPGTFVAFVDEGSLLKLADRRVLVALNDGRNIEAKVSGCTACMAKFEFGDPLLLIRDSRGYSVTIPWFARRSRACERVKKGGKHA